MKTIRDELGKYKKLFDVGTIKENMSTAYGPEAIAKEFSELLNDVLSDTEVDLTDYIEAVDVTNEDQLYDEIHDYKKYMKEFCVRAMAEHFKGLQERIIDNIDKTIDR